MCPMSTELTAVPVEAFGHQALHRTFHRNLVAQRDLILYDDMDDRMHLCVGQANARAPVEALHHVDALVLIHRLPFFGVGWLEGIVDFHFAAQVPYGMPADKVGAAMICQNSRGCSPR
jgi:hypothetical protein